MIYLIFGVFALFAQLGVLYLLVSLFNYMQSAMDKVPPPFPLPEENKDSKYNVSGLGERLQ